MCFMSGLITLMLIVICLEKILQIAIFTIHKDRLYIHAQMDFIKLAKCQAWSLWYVYQECNFFYFLGYKVL